MPFSGAGDLRPIFPARWAGLRYDGPLGQAESKRSDPGRAVSRILSAPNFFGGENHLSQQPVPGTRFAMRNSERAAPGSPIWPCTRWGFPCLEVHTSSGGLLPHLFTLTSCNPETGIA